MVFDPFMGTGSAGIAALRLNRKFIGIELYPEWFEIARKRIDKNIPLFQNFNCTLYLGDSLEVMKEKLKDDTVDFIVTSPPYWNILSKVDRKAKRERVNAGLPASYGFHEKDLACLPDYHEFLSKLRLYFSEMFRVLKTEKYAAVIVSDFRHRERYYLFHADVARILEDVNFVIQGLIVLVQNNKNLYAYGYPTTYVPNVCNHFVIIARKLKNLRK